MGIAARLFGNDEPQGYYDRIQKSYQIPKVERLEKANAECQRITKLNARSFIGVSISFHLESMYKAFFISVDSLWSWCNNLFSSCILSHCYLETKWKIWQRNSYTSQKLPEKTVIELIIVGCALHCNHWYCIL